MKTLALVAIILLAAVSATAYSPSYQWSITVQTDKPYYYTGNRIHVNGTLTYGGYSGSSQNKLVTIVLGASSSPVSYQSTSTSTDSDGNYNASFTLSGPNAVLGEWMVNVTSGVGDDRTTNQTTFQLINAIYIRAGGDVDPAEAPISRNGDVYSLTDNISGNATDGIIIERNNTILDGAGFTVNGTSFVGSNGINLTGVDNVTVKNISVKSFHDGVYEYSCSHSHVAETNLSYNDNGIFCQYSDFNTIEGNNITKNAYAGIWLDLSQYNNISGNTLANNTIASNHVGGINLLDFSSYNNIVDNNLVNNTWYGIYIQNSFSNNVFHNNFVNNTHYQAYVDGSTAGNLWDDGYLSGGNYWSNYTGVDQKCGTSQDQPGSDGIGDTPYTIDSNNKDNYPLMSAWNPVAFDFHITGNSVPTMMTNTTITNTGSTHDTLYFNASGASGTGYILVIIPMGLNSTDIKVEIDNNATLNPPYPIITTDGTDYFVYFEFGLSSHQILLIIAVPDLPVPAVPYGTLTAAVAMILVLAGYFMISKRKRARAEMPDPKPSAGKGALWTSSTDGGANSSEQN